MLRWDTCGVDLDDLAARYWEAHGLSQGTREDRLRADNTPWEEVQEMIWNHDDRIVEVLVQLAESAPSDDDAGYVGAGPLEELLYENRDRLREPTDELLAQVDAAARRSSRFRRALASALLEDLPAPVVRQLGRFRDTP